MRLTVLLMLTSITSLGFSDSIIVHYPNGNLKGRVEMDLGMFNGFYTSWYENGQIKAQGAFLNNQKNGVWTLNDSLGNLKESRGYLNNFQYVDFDFTRAVDSLRRDESGLIEYPMLREEDIVVFKRQWRLLEPSETNKHIFENQQLLSIIADNIHNASILKAYTSAENFAVELSPRDAIHLLADKSHQLIGFRIKEVWYYESKRQLAGARIIGLSPVVRNSESGEISELFWL